jgi:hypothetical protein
MHSCCGLLPELQINHNVVSKLGRGETLKSYRLSRLVCVQLPEHESKLVAVQFNVSKLPNKCIVRDDIIKESFNKYCTHIALMVLFDVFTPKHHLCFHLVANLSRHGNPSFYANWRDESLNRVLKACCRNVSQRTFEASLLLRMRDLISDASTLKRGRG